MGIHLLSLNSTVLHVLRWVPLSNITVIYVLVKKNEYWFIEYIRFKLKFKNFFLNFKNNNNKKIKILSSWACLFWIENVQKIRIKTTIKQINIAEWHKLGESFLQGIQFGKVFLQVIQVGELCISDSGCRTLHKWFRWEGFV